MAEFPTYEEMGKKVAEKALDEFLYDGKSIREWMQIIASEDAISRQAVVKAIDKHTIDTKEGLCLDDDITCILEELPPVNPQAKTGHWIPVSERLPNNHECMKNNGLFNVSDGNRSYFGWFDIYDTKRFVKPTIAGFRVDNAVIAWMPLPQTYKQEVEE